MKHLPLAMNGNLLQRILIYILAAATAFITSASLALAGSPCDIIVSSDGSGT